MKALLETCISLGKKISSSLKLYVAGKKHLDIIGQRENIVVFHWSDGRRCSHCSMISGKSLLSVDSMAMAGETRSRRLLEI